MRAHVLVVEDNAANLELLRDWLDAEGYEVNSATNLTEAFGSINARPPDIVLLDVQLGDEDGLALARWIREQPQIRKIPVIAVTAHAMVTEQTHMQEAGCCACISKPVEFKCLAAQLDLWLPGSEKV
jgi:two-component system cell cycle response regulator DivK